MEQINEKGFSRHLMERRKVNTEQYDEKRVTITLRVPVELHEALRKEAEEKNVSVNELILLKINPLLVDFRRLQGFEENAF